jgi:hypothetical protein
MRPSNKAQCIYGCDFELPNLIDRLISTVADQATARWWFSKAERLPRATSCQQHSDQTSQSAPASQCQVGLLVRGGVVRCESLLRLIR